MSGWLFTGTRRVSWRCLKPSSPLVGGTGERAQECEIDAGRASPAGESDRALPKEELEQPSDRRSPVDAGLDRGGRGETAGSEPTLEAGAPEPVVRYERTRPGSLLHMDIKKLARIARVGPRIHGDRSQKVEGVGWEFYHAAIDDASRVAYGEVLGSERKEDVLAFLLRVVAFFERQGVKISYLMTDNGSAYRSKLIRRTLKGLGIRHIFTRPYTPKTNGKASGSSAPRSRNGRTDGPTTPRSSERPRSPPGYATTISPGGMPGSDRRHPSSVSSISG